jgi:hypothetical protein
MKQSELDAAFKVARQAVDAVQVFGMSAGKHISDQQLRDLVQDCLQAAEDVRRTRGDIT